MLALSPPARRVLVVAEGRLVQRSANAELRQGYFDEQDKNHMRSRERRSQIRMGWGGRATTWSKVLYVVLCIKPT